MFVRLSPLKGAIAETTEPATVQKSHGISHMFGEKLRRGIYFSFRERSVNNNYN